MLDNLLTRTTGRNLAINLLIFSLLPLFISYTAIELFAGVTLVTRWALVLAGVFDGFKYTGPGGTMFCVLFRAASIGMAASYGGKVCVVMHTLDRYWKIVHPIHHRKYYRRWMTYVGMILPWLMGFVVKITPTAATSRVVNEACIPRRYWASHAARRVRCYE